VAELNITDVLRKTDAGLAAIKHIDRSLPQSARTLLIMSDGTKSLQDLSRFTPNPSQVIESAQILLDHGLVVVAAATAAAVKPPVTIAPAKVQPVIAPTAPSPLVNSGAIDLKTTIRKATRALQDMLGPSADPLCISIEKCKTVAELTTKVLALESVVASMRSPQKAKEFINAVFPE
jgi:hypothetical protein